LITINSLVNIGVPECISGVKLFQFASFLVIFSRNLTLMQTGVMVCLYTILACNYLIMQAYQSYFSLN